MGFTGPLHLDHNGDGTYTLLAPIFYHYKGTDIEVPAGFKTDFASVPRLFWPLFPPDGKHGKAAVLHDALYQTHGMQGRFTREQCDEIFADAMTSLGVSSWRAWVMYRAVRRFGGLHFVTTALILWCLTGCTGLSGYSRTYTVGYTDASGRSLTTGATFTPLPKGYGK